MPPHAPRALAALATLVATCVAALAGCDRAPGSRADAEAPDEPSPRFRNVATSTAYVGDSACASCHAAETAAYRAHAMARSFHRWTADARVERPTAAPLRQRPTGLSYAVVEEGGALYQVELVDGPDGTRLHELRRRMDWVMGSGSVARTYFTEENGRLFQLPLTWYADHGWDFSPGYEVNNARFDRVLPDRCIACHASYPRALPHLEGKFAETRPGIGCERCHGPGALHVAERTAGARRDPAFDATIVNPARLPLERRLDVCEQCHVHTPVSVLREGRHAFDYLPSQPLRDQWAFFKLAGSIDVVSHADRLRQSACFVATRATPRPLECATCHDPHAPPPDRAARNQPCLGCHQPAALARELARSPSRADHAPGADCASCHMPAVRERTVPHGTFTEHWIRVPGAAPPAPAAADDGPIEAYFARDRAGPEAAVYQGMGGIVYATQAGDVRALGDAAAALERALGSDSARADAYFLLGVAHQQLGRTAEAIRALERSVAIDSARPEPLHALAREYERAGRAADAIDRLYRRALALQPALAWVRADHARFLHAEGRRDEAERAYRAALAERPGLAAAWFDLGTLLAAGARTGAGTGAAEAAWPDAATAAFREAVRLDPQLGEALALLLEVRGDGGAVAGVRALPPPLPSLPARARPPRAVHLAPAADAPGVLFASVPPGAFVQILRPDGAVIRAIPPAGGTTLRWDLRTQAGRPVGGGLYRARVLGRDAAGRPLPPQVVAFGVVRRDGG